MTEPIQFGATAAAPAPAPVAPAPAPVAETAAPVNTALQEAATQVEQAVSQEVERAQEQTAAAMAQVHTHQTILTGLFTEMEGFMNMGKSEVYAVLQRWHGEFKKLPAE